MTPRRKCCICSITNSPKIAGMGVSIHKFPIGAIHDKEVIEQWCQAIGKDSPEALRLKKGDIDGLNCCSLHFEDDCFIKTEKTNRIRRLKPEAVPTKFLEGSSQNLALSHQQTTKTRLPKIINGGSVSSGSKRIVVKLQLPVPSCTAAIGNVTVSAQAPLKTISNPEYRPVSPRKSSKVETFTENAPFTQEENPAMEAETSSYSVQPMEPLGGSIPEDGDLVSSLAAVGFFPSYGLATLSLLQQALQALQASGVRQPSLSALMTEELHRQLDQEIDLTIRPFKPIQLVTWTRLRHAHLFGQIRVRFLYETNAGDGSVLILHPAGPVDAHSIDVNNVQVGQRVPALVKELLNPCVSTVNKPSFALLVCDGYDWRLVGQLVHPAGVEKVSEDEKNNEPEPEQKVDVFRAASVQLPYSSDPRVNDLEQTTTKLVELVSKMQEDRNSASTSFVNARPVHRSSYPPNLTFKRGSFTRSYRTKKRKRHSEDLHQAKSIRPYLKLLKYRRMIVSLNVKLTDQTKENLELIAKVADLKRDLDHIKSVFVEAGPGLAAAANCCNGLLEKIGLVTLAAIAPNPPTPAPSPPPV